MRCIFRRALCATLLLGNIPSVAQALPVIQQGIAPAAFGSIPLAVKHTRFDTRWNRVLNSGLGANTISVRASRLAGMKRLQSVNTSTNQAIRFREDRASGNANDYWSNAAQTLARRSGDCEDYAIAKMQLLMNAGVPAGDMFLVIGNDLTLGSAHALLLVRQAGRLWVLDSLSNRILLSESYTDFRPIISFGGGKGGAWVHGYAVGTVPRDVYVRQAATARSAADFRLGARGRRL